MPYIVDINPDKRNKYTPGTNIKIINDLDLKKEKILLFSCSTLAF